MKKFIQRGIQVLMALTLVLPLFSHADALEWQKVSLEEKLQQKLTHSVAATLAEKYFVLSVNIQLKPAAPSGRVAPGNPNGKPPTDGGERISLGKLDIDAPIFGTGDTKPDGTPTSDLFESIRMLNVSLLIDTSVSDARVEVIKRILTNGLGSLNGKKSEIKVEKAELYVAPPAPVPTPTPSKVTPPPVVEKPWDAKRWAVEFKNPVSFLLIAFLLSSLMTTLFKGYRGLESRKISLLEAENARAEAEIQARNSAAEAEAEAFGGSSKPITAEPTESFEISGAQKGFERLRALLQQNPKEASHLIAQWTKAPAKAAGEALAILPQLLTTDELTRVFSHLSLDDRKEWKKQLLTTVDKAGVSRADAFVSSQIVESMLMPAPKMEDELSELISQLKLTDCVEIALEDSELGAVFVNILPTGQVAKMLSLLPAEQSKAVTLASLKFSDEELRSKSTAIKAAIVAMNAKIKGSAAPFLDRAGDLLSEVGPEKESSIFLALAEAGEYALMEETAKRHFPAELLFRIPAPVLKTCMNRLPMTKLAEMILCRDDSERPIFLDAFGRAGSKLRDLIDVELKQLEGDEVRKRRAEKNQALIWRDFVDVSRNLIRTNETVSDLVEDTLNSWLSEKTGGQAGKSGKGAAGGHLKVA